jgi:uncharacterized protein GlcG (DUF336 family)
MKQGAYIVNTARGKICDRDAIVRALESGQLAGNAGDVWFPQPTKDLAPLAQPNQPLYGIEASNQGRLIVFAGGIPLMDGDDVVGAIGVSGGSVEQDHEVAEAGVTAF